MRANKQPYFYLLPFIAVIIMLFLTWHTSQINPATTSAPLPGTPLPIINLPILTQPTQRLTTKNLFGNVALLNIWASWCPACRKEHPILMAIKEHYHLPIYGINFKDDPDDARAWLKKSGNPYLAIGVDVDGSIEADLDIDGIPETFLLDKHGMIRYRFKGTLDTDTWESTFLPLIDQLAHEQ